MSKQRIPPLYNSPFSPTPPFLEKNISSQIRDEISKLEEVNPPFVKGEGFELCKKISSQKHA